MGKLVEQFNIGDAQDSTIEHVLILMKRMYSDLATAINQKPDLYERTTDGQVTDTFLSNGSLNINSMTNKVEMLVAHPTSTTVQWKTLS